MHHLILGTAGHVDHGKTALVKALTGVDTDRLKEEKERGITIELGFAPLKLPNGRIIGIVDVPGHERFIKNMVAGAAGMDFVMLVIAADEGVMPQTREHMTICSLLGISNGLVVITKSDLADPDWLALVTDEVQEFLHGTFLDGAPLVTASARTGEGLQSIIESIETLVEKAQHKADAGIFRLPIDRIFTMKGFGTVVTGTMISGRIEVGENVEIFPSKRTAKIRGIQVHNTAVTSAEAGQRTAVNLQGLEKEAVERGEVLAHPDTLIGSKRLDVKLRYLPFSDRKLKHRSMVRLHTGTNEVMARVILLDRNELVPGEQAWAQILTDHPVAVVAADRFVIRSYSPVMTLGGGTILDPLAGKHKRDGSISFQPWHRLDDGPPEGRVEEIVGRSGSMGISIRELVVRTGLPDDHIRVILTDMFSSNQVILLDRDEYRVISRFACDIYEEKLLEALKGYHRRFPLKEGVTREELRALTGRFVSPKFFHWALQSLEKGQKVVMDREFVRLTAHRVRLEEDLSALQKNVEGLFIQGDLSPPTVREILDRFAGQKEGVLEVLKVMQQEGTLIKAGEELYFHRDRINKLLEDYRALLIKEGQATPASFRDLTGVSRKFIIPLMEYFDRVKLTIRTGEHRILRERPGSQVKK